MSELLPCPFCGGTAELLQIGNEVTPKRGFEVKCETWGCRTTKRAMVIRQPLEKARGFAIASWNTRAPAEGSDQPALLVAARAVVAASEQDEHGRWFITGDAEELIAELATVSDYTPSKVDQ